MAGVKSDVFGDPLIKLHAIRGTNRDAEKTPAKINLPTADTENLVIEDLDTDSVNEPTLVPDMEHHTPEGPQTPLVIQP